MGSDKYIKQFYQFTEQSIRSGLRDETMIKTRYLYIVGLMLLFFMISGFVKLGSFSTKPTPIVQSEPIYVSKIPAFRMAAVRQVMQTMLLQKAKQISLNEDELMDESWVVMDKVIVIPKVIG